MCCYQHSELRRHLPVIRTCFDLYTCNQLTLLYIDFDGVAWLEVAAQQGFGQQVIEHTLYGAAQGARAVDRVVAVFDEQGAGCVADIKRDGLFYEALPGFCHHQVNDVAQVFWFQRVEDDYFIDTVEQFRAKEFFEGQENLRLQTPGRAGLSLLFVFAGGNKGHFGGLQMRGSNVGCDDDNGVFEIDAAPLRIGQAAITEDLQQQVVDFGV